MFIKMVLSNLDEFICDLKIYLIMSEPPHVKFFFTNLHGSNFLAFDIAHNWTILDILTFDFLLKPPQPLTEL